MSQYETPPPPPRPPNNVLVNELTGETTEAPPLPWPPNLTPETEPKMYIYLIHGYETTSVYQSEKLVDQETLERISDELQQQHHKIQVRLKVLYRRMDAGEDLQQEIDDLLEQELGLSMELKLKELGLVKAKGDVSVWAPEYIH